MSTKTFMREFLKEYQGLLLQNQGLISYFWPGYYDFHFFLKKRNISSNGFGASLSHARLIAAVELIERMAQRNRRNKNPEQVQSTNGFAAHFNPRKAKLSARNELLERDSFFYHYFLQRPFQRVKLSHDLIPLGIQSKDCGVSLMSSHRKVKSCIAWVRSESGGIFIGLATASLPCKNQLIFRKALSEALQNYLKYRLHKPLPLKSFLKKKSWVQEDHIRLGLCPEVGAFYYKTFFERTQKIAKFTFDDRVVRYIDVSSEKRFFDKVFVYQAICSHLQNLFWGPTQCDQINERRFGRLKFKIQDCTVPHIVP